jgi:hypothetical protein
VDYTPMRRTKVQEAATLFGGADKLPQPNS